jgi:hypothetical protein
MNRLTLKIIEILKHHKVPVDTDKFPADTKPRRTYAGYWQRSAGAWSWWLFSQSEPHAFNGLDIASQFAASDLARCKLEETEIYRNPHGGYELIITREGMIRLGMIKPE